MSEAFKQEVRIPIWAITVLMSCLIGVLTYNASFASTKKQVEVNTLCIEKKVDGKVMDQVMERLIRIEDKIDAIKE